LPERLRGSAAKDFFMNRHPIFLRSTALVSRPSRKSSTGCSNCWKEKTIEARAIDERLNASATPAQAAFDLTIEPKRQIAGYVAKLENGDSSERTRAIPALQRQPAIALRALRTARETASNDQRWWIDAAIQEMERQRLRAPQHGPQRSPR
jgi:hypothetical protein